MTMQRRGLLIILSSPSGAGKSTLAKRLRAWDPSIRFSVSATTRSPRAGEVDKWDYHFVDHKAFRRMIEDGEMLEHAEVFGNLYGSPKGPVVEALSQGHDVLFDIDWQGAEQIQRSVLCEDVVSIFILPPSIKELHRRLVQRAQDDEETISRRMTKSWTEISHWDSYQYVLINDDLDKTDERVRSIVQAERLKRSRQPELIEFVRGLKQEFSEL
jgi:guanylate kinase